MEDIEYGSDQELFDPEETISSVDFNSSENSFETLKEDEYDIKVIQRLRKLLTGVPPPPSITVPQHNIAEISDMWKASSNSVIPNKLNSACAPHCTVNSVCEVLSCDWPQIKHCCFYDIYYNKGKISEKLAVLYDKYRERFIHCETSSFITANSPSKYNTAKLDIKKNCSSPGRRLSHLARRRTVFSSESLHAITKQSAFGVERKTILINKKKSKKCIDQLQECTNIVNDISLTKPEKSLLQSPKKVNKNVEYTKFCPTPKKGNHSQILASCIKTPGKKTPSKKTPNKQTPSKKNPSKKTPSKQTPSKKGTRKKTPSKCTPKKNTQLKYITKKPVIFEHDRNSQNVLFLLNKNGKMNREDTLQIDRYSVNTKNPSNMESSQNLTHIDLTHTQKRKLLWAVSAALKNVGIGTRHKYFRTCGQYLFKLCRSLWLQFIVNDTSIGGKGTSDKMYKLASEHVQQVVDKVQMANVDIYSQDSSSNDSLFFK